MKLRLKSDWDVPIQPPAPGDLHPVGHFVGRAKELDLLANELIRRLQGAILISGYRGVGKTSLVYRALWKVEDHVRNKANQKKRTRYLCVLLNAAQLEAEKEKKDDIQPKLVLANIIRRLYTASENGCPTLPETIRNQISRLYAKATAAKFESSETRESDHMRSVLRQTETKLGLHVLQLATWGLSPMPFGVLGGVRRVLRARGCGIVCYKASGFHSNMIQPRDAYASVPFPLGALPPNSTGCSAQPPDRFATR